MFMYETDISEWVNLQIDYIRTKQYDKLDIENLINELEHIIKHERRLIKNNFVSLIGNLLKIKYIPSSNAKSWVFSVINSREEIKEIINDSPALKEFLKLAFECSWDLARKLAISETHLTGKDLPMICPWDLNYVMNEEVG